MYGKILRILVRNMISKSGRFLNEKKNVTATDYGKFRNNAGDSFITFPACFSTVLYENKQERSDSWRPERREARADEFK